MFYFCLTNSLSIAQTCFFLRWYIPRNRSNIYVWATLAKSSEDKTRKNDVLKHLNISFRLSFIHRLDSCCRF